MPTPVLVISSLSLELVHVSVGATRAGVPINPTADTALMAFVTPGTTPGSGDWKATSWETDPTTTPPTYSVLALVGPNGGVVQLTPAIWDCWISVTDNPEAPKRRAGPIEVI